MDSLAEVLWFLVGGSAAGSICNNTRMDREALYKGIKLFNGSQFFEAHEVLEDVWRVAPAAERKFLQGLIQLAVGLHHYSTVNVFGAQSLFDSAARNISGDPADYGLRRIVLLRIVVYL